LNFSSKLRLSTPEVRKIAEDIISQIHNLGYKITRDIDIKNERYVTFEKFQIHVTIKVSDWISSDIYAELSKGIYELGDLHVITRKMLELKKLLHSFQIREMNTTERLYPEDRQGKSTTTSGL